MRHQISVLTNNSTMSLLMFCRRMCPLQQQQKQNIILDQDESLTLLDNMNTIEYFNADINEIDIDDSMYGSKCTIEKQLELIQSMEENNHTPELENHKRTLNKMLHIHEENVLFNQLDLSEYDVATAKQKSMDNVLKKERLKVVDNLLNEKHVITTQPVSSIKKKKKKVILSA